MFDFRKYRIKIKMKKAEKHRIRGMKYVESGDIDEAKKEIELMIKIYDTIGEEPPVDMINDIRRRYKG